MCEILKVEAARVEPDNLFARTKYEDSVMQAKYTLNRSRTASGTPSNSALNVRLAEFVLWTKEERLRFIQEHLAESPAFVREPLMRAA